MTVKRRIAQLAMMLSVVMVIGAPCRAHDARLNQVRTIPLDGVEGRIDHMSMSPDGRHLLIAALGNNSVEIVDAQGGGHASRIGEVKEPQGVVYIAEPKKLVVVSGGDGNVRIYDQALTLAGTIGDLDDADNARYDPQAKLVYVGYGAGALAVIDPEKAAKVAEINLDAHPESFQLEKSGNRIFVNVPGANEIEVVDRKKRQVLAKWPVTDAKSNFPMALDEAHHRLFVGCRKPAKVLAFDTETGKVVAQTDCVGDTDDIFYDAAHQRIYVSGGAGSITLIEQSDADHYRAAGEIMTASGARTSFFSPEDGVLYLAVPHRNNQRAEIRVYKVAG